jgi:hypothetical protein
MFRVTITDHRGRRVPLVPYELTSFVDDPQRTARLSATSHLARQPVTAREVRRGIGYGLLVLPVMLIGALAPSWLAFGLKLPWWAMILAAIPLGAIPAILTIFLVRRTAVDRIAHSYIAADYCASCGYDLKSIGPEEDGCRICPECGAAWRTAAS